MKYAAKKLLLMGLCSALTACGTVPAIYGVPEPQWQRMGETERQAAMARFQEQEAVYAQTRAAADAARKKADSGKVEGDDFCEDPESTLPNQTGCKRRVIYQDIWTPD